MIYLLWKLQVIFTMTERINIKGSGPAQDLETASAGTRYIHRPVKILPDPPGIPFHKQGHVIQDQFQRHTQYKEVYQATTPTETNPLPFDFWIGSAIPQINKGGPTYSLGVNEDRK